MNTNDDMTQRQESDRNHPDYCNGCGVIHPQTTAEIDARIARDQARRQGYQPKRLIIAPHCDDEALGCGGLIAKYPEQCEVVVLATPDGVRYKEFAEAQAILGYQHVHWFDLADGYVGADMARLVGMLDELLVRVMPDELYLPYPSMHQDHIAGYEAGVRASRLSMSEGHWFTPSVYVYDVAAYDLDLYPTDLKWNTFEALDEPQIDAKVEAIAQYSSQRVLTPHPANTVKKQAEAVGAARQVHWAEAYAMVRAVRR